MPTIEFRVDVTGMPHSFIIIDNGSGVEQGYGFAPATQNDPVGPGHIYPDLPHEYDYTSGKIQITNEQYTAIADYINECIQHPPYYNLPNSIIFSNEVQQCAQWVMKVAEKGNVSLPFTMDRGGWNPYGQAFWIGINNIVTNIKNAVSSLFSISQVTQPRRCDPLTFDLDSDGLETAGINSANPVYFDHNGDGNKTSSGWISPDDAFLVLDRNGNGVIDSGRELFGDSTPLLDSEGNVIGKAEDGFVALSQEDTNGDGLVNTQDARWSDLRIWRDLNSDGVSQAQELLTMEEAGVAAIQMGKKENSQHIGNGNVIADLGSFIRTDGTDGTMGRAIAEIGDIDLIEDTFHSTFSDTIPLTDEAQALPGMNGSGQVRSLREAASLSPTLAALLTQYASATTRAEQLALLDQVIIEWGKTSTLAVTGSDAYGGVPTTVSIAGESAGSAGYNTWMTMLQTLERFNGRPFATPATGATSVTINLFSERKAFLSQAWDALRQSVYDGLLLQTRLKPYIDTVSLNINETGISMDFSATGTTFQTRYDQAPDGYNFKFGQRR